MLAETRGSHGYSEYVLTGKGLSLWPVVRDLLSWGDEYYSADGPRRVFQHAQDAGVIGPESLPAETRRAILAAARSRDFRIALKTTRLKKQEDDDF